MTIALKAPKFAAFLWPDHVISARDSRRIREEHNALLNSHANLLAALEEMMSVFSDHEQYDEDSAAVIKKARAVIAKAGGAT